MRAEYEENCLAINDDNKLLHQFCDRLEFIFSFGLRGEANIYQSLLIFITIEYGMHILCTHIMQL